MAFLPYLLSLEPFAEDLRQLPSMLRVRPRRGSQQRRQHRADDVWRLQRTGQNEQVSRSFSTPPLMARPPIRS